MTCTVLCWAPCKLLASSGGEFQSAGHAHEGDRRCTVQYSVKSEFIELRQLQNGYTAHFVNQVPWISDSSALLVLEQAGRTQIQGPKAPEYYDFGHNREVK